MCCFSQPVEMVSNTNIFARSANGRQFLVYGMTYAARTDLAMVLPLPVPPRPPEDAVTFINLERYPDFFQDMRRGFPPQTDPWRSRAPAAVAAGPQLQVHDVGDFEASFVPTLADFSRLNPRFCIPAEAWDRLPAYHDYGFAVFKLKASVSKSLSDILRRIAGGSATGSPGLPRRVHPMAFSFPRRNPDLLYFPTVHIHDRAVHPHAYFDHILYCQVGPEMSEYLQGWQKSPQSASGFMNCGLTHGVVDPDQSCWRLPLHGRLQNKDTLIGKGGARPELASV
jgi:hypothetical protein